jgi:hypothetical protein
MRALSPLVECARQWARHGFEFRKQYVALRTRPSDDDLSLRRSDVQQ